MLGRRKQALINVLENSKAIAYDFRRRGVPFEFYRVTDYQLYHKLKEQEMLPQLDTYLERLFNGDVDDGNANMLDSMILNAAREAGAELEMQHYGHGDILRRLIARRHADHEDYIRILRDRKKELEQLEAEYAETCRMVSKEKEGM